MFWQVGIIGSLLCVVVSRSVSIPWPFISSFTCWRVITLGGWYVHRVSQLWIGIGFRSAMEKTIIRCWMGCDVVEEFAVGGIEMVIRWMDWFWMVWVVSVMLLLVSCGLFHVFLVVWLWVEAVAYLQRKRLSGSLRRVWSPCHLDVFYRIRCSLMQTGCHVWPGGL